eukprot:scaffold228540_cov36-Tisochrysis_lutea.AAC.3
MAGELPGRMRHSVAEMIGWDAEERRRPDDVGLFPVPPTRNVVAEAEACNGNGAVEQKFRTIEPIC